MDVYVKKRTNWLNVVSSHWLFLPDRKLQHSLTVKNNGPRQLGQRGNVVSLFECFELFPLALRNLYLHCRTKELPEQWSDMFGCNTRGATSA